MRMAKPVVTGLLVAFLVLLTGCAASYWEYGQRSQKPNINAFTQTRYDSGNYEVLGTVTASGRGMCVLGVVANGRDGQALLWEEAEGKFGDRCTGIKDITSWSEYQSILGSVYAEIKTTYVGTAVREGAAP